MGKSGKLELMSIETIRRELRAIKDAIATAHVALSDGADVDLVILQNSVKTVCNRIDKLPQLVGSNEIEPLIKSIVTDFDTLSQALDSPHQNLTANEGPTNHHYSNTSNIPNKDDNNAGDA